MQTLRPARVCRVGDQPRARRLERRWAKLPRTSATSSATMRARLHERAPASPRPRVSPSYRKAKRSAGPLGVQADAARRRVPFSGGCAARGRPLRRAGLVEPVLAHRLLHGRRPALPRPRTTATRPLRSRRRPTERRPSRPRRRSSRSTCRRWRRSRACTCSRVTSRRAAPPTPSSRTTRACAPTSSCAMARRT